eukprot:m.174440 g.174440  ORF g.174440 m.174440 type:complete len:144 (+) comp14878_c0_seq3:963-1394(+)
MLTGMPRSKTVSREEAHLLMSVVHKVHGKEADPSDLLGLESRGSFDFSGYQGSVPQMDPTMMMTYPQQYHQHSQPLESPPIDPAVAKKIEKKKGNRLAAKRCRERKKQYISFLESRCVDLEASIQSLQSTLQEIQPHLKQNNN